MAANRSFAIAAIGVPLGALIVALAAGSVAFLNFVHVFSGAIWVGMAVFLAVVFGPTMGRVPPEIRGQIATAMTPKAVFLLPSIAVTAIVSGPVLAVWMGYWDLGSPTVLAAIVLTAAALVIGLLILRVQLHTYAELRSPPPDGALLGRLARQNAVYGFVQTAVLLLIVVVMSAVRSGLLLS